MPDPIPRDHTGQRETERLTLVGIPLCERTGVFPLVETAAQFIETCQQRVTILNTANRHSFRLAEIRQMKVRISAARIVPLRLCSGTRFALRIKIGIIMAITVRARASRIRRIALTGKIDPQPIELRTQQTGFASWIIHQICARQLDHSWQSDIKGRRCSVCQHRTYRRPTDPARARSRNGGVGVTDRK